MISPLASLIRSHFRSDTNSASPNGNRTALSFRALFIQSLALMATILCLTTSWASAAEKVFLDEPVDDTRIFGVGTRLDVSGKLLTVQSGKEPAEWKINLSAGLSYRERRLLGFGREAESLRSLRDYEVATVDIQVNDQTTSVKLDDKLKLVTAQGRPEGLEFCALAGPMTTDELNLLRTPCDSLGLIALLPGKEIEVGQSWTPDNWVGQFLAGLDAATESKMTCTLESVTDGIAKVRFTGSVNGATVGSPAKVSLEGSLSFDLKTKSISGADLVQKETRSIGVVSPGLDITARVRLLRKPATIPGRLADESIVKQGQEEAPLAKRQLRFDSPWNMTLLYNRDWHLFHHNDKVAIFRWLEQGGFVAQLNMAPIPPVAAGQMTSADAFQRDIQQSLGEKLSSLGAPETKTFPDGRKMLKVVAEGKVGEREMTWIYYLMAAPSGRQASLMFTVDRKLAEKVQGPDLQILESLQFGPTTTATR